VTSPITVRAPGRVNLIGEHTDYSDGFCLPVAIDRECRIVATPNGERFVRARSQQLGGDAVIATSDGAPADGSAPWGKFIAGTVAVVRERGHVVRGTNLEINSTVPAGSGLSSSSALAVALVLTLLPPDAPERDDRRELARLALAAEVRATGVPGGLLDQMASLYGRAGHALLLDCRTLRVEPVPLPPELMILIIHSGLPRELADSEYAARRRACEAAAQRLGVPALRDATAAQVVDDPIARHVVSENARVLEFCAALHAHELDRLGPILLAGHASLRDDFRVSTPELDLLVDLFVREGALGARLTGAGFGGCVLALAPTETAEHCLTGAMTAYSAQTGHPPMGFAATASAGAEILD
jgi:galactokinase